MAEGDIKVRRPAIHETNRVPGRSAPLHFRVFSKASRHAIAITVCDAMPSIMCRITPKSVYSKNGQGNYYLHGYAQAISKKV
jgi:hypothetical protein